MESREEKYPQATQPPDNEEVAPEGNDKTPDPPDKQELSTPGEATSSSQVIVKKAKGTLEFIRVSQTSVQEEDAIPASAHERRNMVLPLRPLSQRPSRVRNLMSFIEPEYFDAPSTSADPNDPTTGTSSIDEQLLAPRRSRLPSARIERNPTFFQSGTPRRSVEPENVNVNDILKDDNDADRRIPPPSDAVPAKSCIRNQSRRDTNSVRFNPGGPQVKPYYIENYNPRYKVRRKWRQERARGMRFDSSVPMETRRILAAVADFNPGWAVHEVFDRIHISDRTTPNLTAHEDTSQDTRARHISACSGPQTSGSPASDLSPQTRGSSDISGIPNTDLSPQTRGSSDISGLPNTDLSPQTRGSPDISGSPASDLSPQTLGSFDISGSPPPPREKPRGGVSDRLNSDGNDAVSYNREDTTVSKSCDLVSQQDGSEDVQVNNQDVCLDRGQGNIQDDCNDDDYNVGQDSAQGGVKDNYEVVLPESGKDSVPNGGQETGHIDGQDSTKEGVQDYFQDAERQNGCQDDDLNNGQDDGKYVYLDDIQKDTMKEDHADGQDVGQNDSIEDEHDDGQDDGHENTQGDECLDDSQDDGLENSQDDSQVDCHGDGTDDVQVGDDEQNRGQDDAQVSTQYNDQNGCQEYDKDDGQNDADVEVYVGRIARLSRGRRFARSVRKAVIRVGRFLTCCCTGRRS